MPYIIELTKKNCIDCNEEIWLFPRSQEEYDNVIHVNCPSKQKIELNENGEKNETINEENNS